MAYKLNPGDRVLVVGPPITATTRPRLRFGYVRYQDHQQRHGQSARAIYYVSASLSGQDGGAWFTYDALELYTPPPVDDQPALERWLST
jgi:hypothetical protein